jgi:hypothetical protein
MRRKDEMVRWRADTKGNIYTNARWLDEIAKHVQKAIECIERMHCFPKPMSVLI